MNDEQEDLILIAYILDSINKILEISTKDPDFKSKLDSNWVIHDAIVHRLQTLSESTQRLSNKVKNFAPDIPWKSIAGFRNILLHQYLGDLDPEILWHVITHELPRLHKTLLAYTQRK
jgi:uncharacterized protein with HEPN domain